MNMYETSVVLHRIRKLGLHDNLIVKLTIKTYNVLSVCNLGRW